MKTIEQIKSEILNLEIQIDNVRESAWAHADDCDYIKSSDHLNLAESMQSKIDGLKWVLNND